MKLTITRHGETKENIVGILQGHLPGTLSTHGIEQAKRVALRLKDEKFDFIYSSDLKRATDTAKEITKYHPNTQIKFVENLRERDFGEFQGRNKSDFGWDTIIEPKEGESMEEIYKRAKSFLYEIIHEHADDSILFICHGGIGKSLVAVITGKKYTEIKSIEGLHNTSISTFEIGEDKNYKIIRYNCIKHLK